nr:MAG TPA: hypothetical protein [Caudoviricetes sp.]
MRGPGLRDPKTFGTPARIGDGLTELLGRRSGT